MLKCLAIFFLLLLQVLLFLMITSVSIREIPGKTLFVIAHPDDEVMFFGPSILRSASAYILCLSDGSPNGTVRTREFYKSCKVLGLKGKCFVSERKTLPDGFEYNWAKEEILEIVDEYAQRVEPDRIVTFDSEGVSGHPNHIAIAKALAMSALSRANYYAWNSSNMREVGDGINGLPVYGLKSGPAIVKYLGIYGAVLYFIAAGGSIAQGFFAITPLVSVLSMTLKKAFLKHASQQVWHRMLWVLWSRFLYYNHLVPLRQCL